MTDEIADRIARTLERIADALEVGNEDDFRFYARISDLSKAVVNLEEHGIEIYNPNVADSLPH
jgi:hypothetical protein